MLLARRVFLLLFGVCYAAAFASLLVQVDGLLGSQGIEPAAELLARAKERLGPLALWRLPTLLWLDSSDAALEALCKLGVLAGACLAAGAAPFLSAAACWILYLSLACVGGVFLQYQWDALLLEAGLLTLFLAPTALHPARAAQAPVSRLGVCLLRFLLFRLMFLSGWVKLLSGDPTWRSLSALEHHFLTQPLPAWTSPLADALPGPVLAACTAATLAIEIAAPCFAWGPRRLRLGAAAALALLQLAIAATGSYGFFNVTALALCVLLLDDRALLALLPARVRGRFALERAGPAAPARRWMQAPAWVLAAILVVPASALALARLRLPVPGFAGELARLLAPLRSMHSYGLFAVMTTERPEIVIEGSDDGERWREYAFRWKPGRLDRAPRFAGLHMPRLDWQMWFAALSRCDREPWFASFQRRLLEGSPTVLALLEDDPFGGRPPRRLRTRLYRYEWSSPDARRARGEWWTRTELRAHCPELVLRGGELWRAE